MPNSNIVTAEAKPGRTPVERGVSAETPAPSMDEVRITLERARAAHCAAVNDEGDAEKSGAADVAEARVDDLSRRLRSRPITSLDDVVALALLAEYWSDWAMPNWDWRTSAWLQGDLTCRDLVAGVLALARVPALDPIWQAPSRAPLEGDDDVGLCGPDDPQEGRGAGPIPRRPRGDAA
jgi:hypothetical protein